MSGLESVAALAHRGWVVVVFVVLGGLTDEREDIAGLVPREAGEAIVYCSF